MIVANDGLFDGPGFNSEESQLMSNCLHLLFRVLLAFFAWSARSISLTYFLFVVGIIAVNDRHCKKNVKHPVPDLVKPSFVIFDIRAL